MELSTIINAESSLQSSLHRKLCLRVDVAMLASTLANGGSPDPYLVPETDLDQFEDDEAKVRVLEQRRDYLELKLCIKETAGWTPPRDRNHQDQQSHHSVCFHMVCTSLQQTQAGIEPPSNW